MKLRHEEYNETKSDGQKKGDIEQQRQTGKLACGIKGNKPAKPETHSQRNQYEKLPQILPVTSEKLSHKQSNVGRGSREVCAANEIGRVKRGNAVLDTVGGRGVEKEVVFVVKCRKNISRKQEDGPQAEGRPVGGLNAKGLGVWSDQPGEKGSKNEAKNHGHFEAKVIDISVGKRERGDCIVTG